MMINWAQISGHFALSIGAAIVILVIALIVNAIVKRIIAGAVKHSHKLNQASSQRIRTIQTILTSIVSYVILFIAVTAILRKFGVPTSAILTSAGVAGLAIGFGAQGLVSDVVTGFFILLEGQVDIEEYVTVAGYSGIVEEFTLRLMKIRGFNGDLHYVPNRQVSSLTNHSRGNMQALVDLSISYESNIDDAINVLQRKCDEIAAATPDIIEGPNVVGVQNLGSSDITLRIIAKTVNLQQWAVERILRKALKEALDEAAIEIPYPHTTIIQKQSSGR
ncbi:mechanosensitive ion channel family protein [Alicyclobacillus sp. SO9]|uniref:mechanosensitive ion channel family protein n=1 Tax=Alicyclobacillus sp. SO9 TaxID=2665646 RepID=UPI0018E6E822|nr:mechanosensitive ion channel family protein [Alicyclobacillus sp. SO9]QQE77602.1 mechanosensitive ion channel family protein [Alicyclobacillus sp. SO9]